MKVKGIEKYWNPVLETLPQEQLRKLQFKKFKRIVEWGYNNSKLYRRIYDKAGFKPEDLKEWKDIAKVPTLQKEDYREAQAKDLRGSRFIRRIHGMTGSGGASVGPIFCGLRVSGILIGFSFLSATTFLLPIGQVIMPARKLAVRLSPAVF